MNPARPSTPQHALQHTRRLHSTTRFPQSIIWLAIISENRAIKTVAVFEAKSRLSEILAAVERGEEYTVTKHGKPVARIVPSGQVDSTSMADAKKLIARIKASRRNSNLTDEELREAIEDGRD